MTPTITRKRHLFTSRESLTVSYTEPSSPRRLTHLADTIVHVLLPEVIRNDTLRNFEGLPAERALSLSTPSEWQPRGMEVCFFGGVVTTGRVEQRGERSEVVREPFWLSLTTKFDRFDESQSIIHRAHEIRSPTLPSTVPLAGIGRAFPLTLSVVRFGFRGFRTTRVTSMLGIAPILDEQVALEADATTLSLTGHGDAVGAGSSSPLHDSALWDLIIDQLLVQRV